MLKIKVSNLKPGAKLGKDLYSYDSQLLLPRGTVVTDEHLNSLAARNISEVYINETTARPRSEKPFPEVSAFPACSQIIYVGSQIG